MNYTAEHLDAEKLEEGFEGYRRNQEQKLFIAQAKAQAFFDGYSEAMRDARSMLHCCNYESEKKRTKAFLDGTNSMLYELCKELDVGGQDIRNMDISVDEKAALIAERIRQVFQQTDGEAE